MIQVKNATCIGGKIWKNLHGLKIHETKMCQKYLMKKQVVQCTRVSPSETKEEQFHSVKSFQVPKVLAPVKTYEHCCVKWHQACKDDLWQKFDNDADRNNSQRSYGSCLQ